MTYTSFFYTESTLGGMDDLPFFLTQGACSALEVLGLICTAWRIYFRLRIHRFWWEDAWAAVALFSCLTSLVGEWIFLLTDGLSSIIGYWFRTMGFTCLVRSTHLSILFSIIRIVREPRLRIFTYLIAACCGICWAVIVSGKIWHCTSDPRWHRYEMPVCLVEPQILIFEFTSDCIIVGILVTLPLCMLWRVKLPRRQRRMILSIFASSVVLAFAAIFHTVGRVLKMPIVLVAGVGSEIACSIIVCNLLVVVTYAYRFLRRDGASSEPTTTTTTATGADDFTQPTGRPAQSPMTLTTVEINLSMPTTEQYTTEISAQSRSVLPQSV